MAEHSTFELHVVNAMQSKSEGPDLTCHLYDFKA